MSDKKYYTPSEKELCQIGLEVELLIQNQWQKQSELCPSDFTSPDIGSWCDSRYGNLLDLLKEMSSEKHYIPHISEFHVGFEYELKSNDIWDEVASDLECDDINTLKDDIKYSRIRVKYLDKDDIEAEGWSFQKEGVFKIVGTDNDIFEMYQLARPWVTINSALLRKSVFHGTIKNRSELRKVMGMIGVTN